MSPSELLAQISLLGIAIGANALSALAGGGAGLVQLPALILLGLPFAMALATHKVASVALGLGATGRHWRASSLDLKRSALVLAAGLPGVCLGASLVLVIPDHAATRSLGLLTLGLGIYSARKADLGTTDNPRPLTARTIGVGACGLFIVGILNGSLTSGTGLFVTLWLVRWFGLSYPRAVAHTLVLVGLGWNGTGALVLGLNGEIRWDWLPALVLGSLIGGFLGAHYSLVKGSRLVKRSFEILALLMGGSLLLRSF